MLEAFGHDLARLKQAFADRGGRSVGREPVERGTDSAALAFDRMAEHAGGRVPVEEMFAALDVACDNRRAVLGSD